MICTNIIILMRVMHQQQQILISLNSVELKGNLVIPNQAQGVVLFVQSSDSNRFSHHNRHLANTIQQSGLATLLIDLLTTAEENIERQTKQLGFNINLLVKRLVYSTRWLLQNPTTKGLKIGYFGANTASAAAFLAAADCPDAVSAIVTLSGRPDLAASALSRIKAPSLIIVGEKDSPTQEINRKAFYHLPGENQMVIIPEARHLFKKAGALDEVARLASQWFNRYLSTKDRFNLKE